MWSPARWSVPATWRIEHWNNEDAEDKSMTDLTPYLPADDELAALSAHSLSDVALGMHASRILVIAYAVRAKIESGAQVANFTVGDFSPREFQVPAKLKEDIAELVAANQTNYPPAHGTPELRGAIKDHYVRHLGLDYPIDAFVVSSGARPALYATYRCLLNAGEKVVTPAPSWNNDNFCQLVGAEHVIVATRAEDAFMPTAEALAPHLDGARLLVLCSPMNPAGTLMRENQMAEICELVLAENARRSAAGERLLYVIYDQVYRMLTLGDLPHLTPMSVAPEMARYTILTDAISKCFAATGLRVGWVAAPPFIAGRIKALMTHMGAWAPRPEQMATARLLNDDAAVEAYMSSFKAKIRERLDLLYTAFSGWKSEGLPVDVIAPEGAIYLSVHLDLEGRPGFPDEASVLSYLLDEAGCAVVPFSAFGDYHNRGWVRFSVGAVSIAEIRSCITRLHSALVRALG
jgi:aspartate aminotransferase